MSWMHMREHNLTRRGGEREQRPADPGRRAAAMEPAAVRARTGASGGWRGELSRPPLGLGIATSARKPRLQPSLGNPQSELLEEESKERARRGKEGRGGGGRGRDPLLILHFSSPSSSGGNLCWAGARLPPLLLSTLGDHLPFSPRSPPSLPPSLLRASSPPPRLPPPPAAAAVAASAEPEMGRERARRSSSGPTTVPARSCLRPRRRCRRLGVPRLQSRA